MSKLNGFGFQLKTHLTLPPLYSFHPPVALIQREVVAAARASATREMEAK